MSAADDRSKLRVVGLFAGIGGIELGLARAGHRTELLCELHDGARGILKEHFEGVSLHDDVTTLSELPPADLVTAGFPCQDLSQAGRTAGIAGSQSGLVDQVFRLLDNAPSEPRWLLLENVSFMLSLDRGKAMSWLTEGLEERGYTWAYRVVDSLAFGLPQRRQRVLLLASKTDDPRPILLAEDEEPNVPDHHDGELACGFYWTEGLRGLGWAVDAVPTLKGGSTVGIPSPPAIWMPGSNEIVTPELRDVERLQGFPSDWTASADEQEGARRSDRWKLVGNAVSVPVAEWLGERLRTTSTYDESADLSLVGPRWPRAAWGKADERKMVDISMWPLRKERPHLWDFLEFEPRPLSRRATAGFLERADRGNLNISPEMLSEAREHLRAMDEPLSLAV